MSEPILSSFWPLVANFLGVLALTLGLYVFILNPRHRANRYVSLTILVLAVGNLMVALMYRASTLNQVSIPLTVEAALSPTISPWLVLTTLVLIKPEWLQGRMRWLRNVLIALVLLPGLLTLIDVLFKTNLYLPAFESLTYKGGYVQFADFLTSTLGRVIVILYLPVIGSLLLLPLFYFAFLDRSLPPLTRRLARLLFVAQVLVVAINLGAQEILPPGVPVLLGSIIYALSYAYAIFQQMISERIMQRTRLQTRLITLTLVITIPMLVLVTLTLASQARDTFEKNALAQLEMTGNDLALSLSQWVNSNVSALQNLAAQPGIISMDAEQQRPILQAFAANYPYTYLVSTTDTTGMNIARNDAEAPKDYSDRSWFQDAFSGQVAYQTLIGRTTGRPALVVAVPVRTPERQIVGVVMFASELTDISAIVGQMNVGQNSFAYLVDSNDQLLAHPDLQEGATELIDYSADQPLLALRNAYALGSPASELAYRDPQGIDWRSYAIRLDNNWAVIIQQRQSEISALSGSLLWTSVGLTLAGSLILVVLLWATMRQTIRPVITLTQTVQAITAGRLDLDAPVEGDDEIGVLARSFNAMTAQVRDSISSLEQRVAQRTLELEYRSAQLQAAADVGHAAATIRSLDELLPVVVNLISQRFGFYHVGIFLLDERGEYAVLRAANSAGGQAMLARGHRLKVGQQGIVGYVTSQRQPRIALDVGADAVFFDNPNLPDTRSEMALPLLVGDELLGALDVQSTQPNAFADQDIRTLQVLADQVSTALYGAGLVQQVDQALQAERRAYATQSQRAWLDYAHSLTSLGFVRDYTGLTPIPSITDERTRQVLQSGQSLLDPADPAALFVPVIVRRHTVGILKLHKPESAWLDDDIRLVESLSEQLGLALDSARSYEETQTSAQRERILGEIGARIRQTLDLETILKTASQELRQALGLSRVIVRLGTPPSPPVSLSPSLPGRSPSALPPVEEGEKPARRKAKKGKDHSSPPNSPPGESHA